MHEMKKLTELSVSSFFRADSYEEVKRRTIEIKFVNHIVFFIL